MASEREPKISIKATLVGCFSPSPLKLELLFLARPPRSGTFCSFSLCSTKRNRRASVFQGGRCYWICSLLRAELPLCSLPISSSTAPLCDSSWQISPSCQICAFNFSTWPMSLISAGPTRTSGKQWCHARYCCTSVPSSPAVTSPHSMQRRVAFAAIEFPLGASDTMEQKPTSFSWLLSCDEHLSHLEVAPALRYARMTSACSGPEPASARLPACLRVRARRTAATESKARDG